MNPIKTFTYIVLLDKCLFQKNRHNMQTPKLKVREKARKIRNIGTNNQERGFHTKRMFCPICRVKSTTSDWHFMDHVAKKHQRKGRIPCSTSSDERTYRHSVKRLFNKYTHVRIGFVMGGCKEVHVQVISDTLTFTFNKCHKA